MLPLDLIPSDYPVTFGRYRLLELLGQGGYARVFLAEMQGVAGFRKLVALKLIHKDCGGDPEHFVREGRLGGILKHRNVVDTYDIGVEDGQAYIAMERVDGLSLAALCKQRTLPPSVMLEVGLGVCRGLAYAHRLRGHDERLGLVHRDLKPGNILIGWDGSVKVADFGIALLTGLEGRLPESSAGSPGYMSPEQWTRYPLDQRSDLFSLCVVLCEVCLGRRLHQCSGTEVMRQAVLSIEERIKTTDLLDELDERIAGMGPIIARGLKINPKERFENADELADKLREVQAQVSPEPSLDRWLSKTLERREKDWKDRLALSTLAELGVAPHQWADTLVQERSVTQSDGPATLAAGLAKLAASPDLDGALAALFLIETALQDVSNRCRNEQLEQIGEGLAEAGLPLERSGNFPYLVADRERGRYWYRGVGPVQLRPGSISERLLYAVATQGPDLGRAELYEKVWEQPFRPPASDAALRVMAHKIRKKLLPLGLEVELYGEGQYVLGTRPGVLAWQATSGRSHGAPASERSARGQHGTTNLARSPNAFVGRSAEMEALSRLHADSHGLVTVLGPPGTGKTRLAREWALAQLEASTVDNAWFCDLSVATTATGVLAAVALALDVPLTDTEQENHDLVMHLGHAIVGHGKTLIVFDNAEQVVEPVRELLLQWWEMATEARFVVTSRVPLDLEMEQRMRLAPLPLPESSESLSTNAAVALFVDRAQCVQPAFTLDDDNADDISAIVTELDGLPLAIELAAARAAVWPPKTLRSRLSDRFKLLTRSSSSGPRRQATLRGALDWSWDLLTPWEQSALAQCSVFRGGFDWAAAEAVIDTSEWSEAPWVVDTVAALVEHSLLMTDARGAEDSRLTLLVCVAEYASEKLELMDERVRLAAEQRHVQHYAKLGTDDHLESLNRHGGQTRQARLAKEQANLIEATHRAMAAPWPEEAFLACRAAIQILSLIGPYTKAVDLGEQVLKLDLPELRRGQLLQEVGRVLRYIDDPRRAMGMFEQALSVFREAGDSRAESWVLGDMGDTQVQCVIEPEEALKSLEMALALHREAGIGQRHLEGLWLGTLSRLHGRFGRISIAKQHLESALVIAREIGDRRCEGIWLYFMGGCNQKEGHIAEALQHTIRALAIAQEVGNRRHEGTILAQLGHLAEEEGRNDDALEYMEASLAVCRELGLRRAANIVRADLGRFHWKQGRIPVARQQMDEAKAVAMDMGDEYALSHICGNLGDLLWEQGDSEGAETHFEQAIALGHKTLPTSAAAFRGSLALVRAHDGDLAGARALLDQGEEVLRRTDIYELCKLLSKRAQIEHDAGEEDAARVALAEALAIAQKLGHGIETEFRKRTAELSHLWEDAPD